MEKILNIFKKPREKVIEDLISGIVKDITNNYEYQFTYEEQQFILDAVNSKVLEDSTEKRNKLVKEAREIQDAIVVPKQTEEDE